MPLCGTKKSKKQKRDPSPPYATERTQPDPELERLNRQTTEFEKLNRDLQKELKNKDGELSILRQENKKLGDKLASLKNEVEEAAKSAKAGDVVKKEEDVRVTSQISKDIKEFESKLGDLDLQINVQHKRKGDNEAEKSKLEERFQQSQQELESERKAREESRREANESLETLRKELEALNKTLESERAEKQKAEEDRDRLRKDKDSFEQKLSLTSKELEIARKESHIPRSPTRAPSDEWKAKIETAEVELSKERQLRLDKERENSRLNSDKDLLSQEKEGLLKGMDELRQQKDEEINSQKDGLELQYRNEINLLREQVENNRAKLARAEEEKDKLLTRLSSATAARVLDGNPNIADLSDPQRPQKIGEQLSQVYDDQWTDASELLEKLEMDDDTILKTLLDLLVAIYKHCQEAAESQQGRIEEDLFLPPLETPSSPDTNGTEPLKSPTGSKQSMSKIPRFSSHKSSRPTLPNLATEKKKVENDSPARDKSKKAHSVPKLKGEKLPEVPIEVRQGIKEYRKKVAKQVWPVIEKEVQNKLRRSEEFGDRIVDACKTYITKCVELCWLMRIQDPPVTLQWAAPEDDAFNSDVYRAYTKTGSRVEYVVWPAVYLHEGGPILMKGVAQGTNG